MARSRLIKYFIVSAAGTAFAFWLVFERSMGLAHSPFPWLLIVFPVYAVAELWPISIGLLFYVVAGMLQFLYIFAVVAAVSAGAKRFVRFYEKPGP